MVRLVLAGAGARGADAYARYALCHPDRARFVAVAEPNPARRNRFGDAHAIPERHRYADWSDLFAAPQLGEGALVCTQDQQHVEPAVAALQAGYHVMLEKPMAHRPDACVQLVRAAERSGASLQVCHVLRYTAFFRTLNELLRTGRLGDLVTVQHRENVAYWHMAHSYVRGAWRREGLSNPLILSKCSHDLDILGWNIGSRCVRLSSFGSLRHFRPDPAMGELPARCTDGCPIERECQFSAVAIYVEQRPFRAGRHRVPLPLPLRHLTDGEGPEAVMEALRTGPYGRCVYRCDNDVVDHQIISLEYENGISAALIVHGHSHEDYRSMRYVGTRATLFGQFGDALEMTLHDKLSGETVSIPFEYAAGGHGGGDLGLMASYVDFLDGRAPQATSARESLESHLLGFAAEEARATGSTILMDAFRKRHAPETT
jgi:predicted dehydrogenase